MRSIWLVNYRRHARGTSDEAQSSRPRHAWPLPGRAIISVRAEWSSVTTIDQNLIRGFSISFVYPALGCPLAGVRFAQVLSLGRWPVRRAGSFAHRRGRERGATQLPLYFPPPDTSAHPGRRPCSPQRIAHSRRFTIKRILQARCLFDRETSAANSRIAEAANSARFT